jgi:predicted transposase YbfD/YdcC
MRFIPKKTVELIVKNNHGYVIPLKGNQKRLREHLLESIKGRKAQSTHSYKQKSHGRDVSYRVKVWSVSPLEEWAGLGSLISRQRKGIRGKKEFDTQSYYISSENASAYMFGKWIQGHRQIENNLHWVKDVILEEDSCQITKPHSALVMGILRSIGLNLLRLAGVSSVTEGMMKMCTGVEGLMGLMSPSSPSGKVFV